jgi:hypothetical protein
MELLVEAINEHIVLIVQIRELKFREEIQNLPQITELIRCRKNLNSSD